LLLPAATFDDKLLQTLIPLHLYPCVSHYQSALHDSLFKLIHEPLVSLFLFKLVHLLSECSFVKVLQQNCNEEIHYDLLSNQDQKHDVNGRRVRVH
jgi:hypothetical protein